MTADPALAPVLRALAGQGAASSDFDLNPGTVLPAGRRLRPAGVLVPVRTGPGVARLVLTKRASGLKHHPGQIAFPGGKQDPGDADLVATALREAQEEIGLDPAQVRVLGTMPAHETVTGYIVTPVLAQVTGAFVPVPEPGEVDEVFDVPLARVLDPGRFQIEGRYWQGRLRRYYAVPYGPYYIWGATARILRALAEGARA